MEIEILEMNDRKMRFILKNSTPGMANSLRRALLEDIPKMAIDKVDFNLGTNFVNGKEGNSKTPLFDEVIAHRLGLVPLPTDYKLFNFKDKCSCGGEGCTSCTVDYLLNKVGPCTVMSSDLDCVGDSSLAPVEKSIPIVELEEGESIFLTAHAVMGTAAQHSKWQVALAVGYKYLPKIKIGNEITGEKAETIAKACPKTIFEVKDGKLVVKDGKEIECSLCKTCMEKPFERENIEVKGDENNFVFTFETDGSITAQQALDKATEVLSEKFKKLAESAASF